MEARSDEFGVIVDVAALAWDGHALDYEGSIGMLWTLRNM